MSFDIELNSLTSEWKEWIKKGCNVYPKATKYEPIPQGVTVFRVNKNENRVRLPLSLWSTMLNEFPNAGGYDKISAKFTGTLLEEPQRDQKTVIKEARERLDREHCVLLALRTGFGKTFVAINLICHYGLKTVVLCHVSTLHKQWKDEATRFAPSLKVQIVGPTNKLDPQSDVYVMGILKSTHYEEETFKNIGMVVLDEAHLTLTETFSNALLMMKCKYLIGLSATPDRGDSMHRLLYSYFGPKDSFIVRTEQKNFTVIKWCTKFRPEVRFMWDGSPDWSHIISSLAINPDRQKFIAGLCKDHPDKKILILSDRVCEVVGCENYNKCPHEKKAKGLIPLLTDMKISCDHRSGPKKSHDETARVVVGSFKKLSVGYDSKRDLLILASDKTDVRQSEGRIRCHGNIVIDIVDLYKTFEKHWQQREAWYLERGATIEVRGTPVEETTRVRLLGSCKSS